MTHLPNLEDTLGMVEALTSNPRMGRAFRKAALGLADVDPNTLDGLVLDGVVHEIHFLRKEYAPCGCKDGKHEFSTDAPWFKRGYWTDRGNAQKTAAKLRGHVVSHIVVHTPMVVEP